MLSSRLGDEMAAQYLAADNSYAATTRLIIPDTSD
jgi:hypothetical protein